MYSTSDVAKACGVEKVTVRSWLSRAPGFTIGEYDGLAKNYTTREGLTLVIASELIARGLGVPYEILPLADRIAAGGAERTVWVHRTKDGDLAFTEAQPPEPCVCLPLASLSRRLVRTASPQRIARMTR